MFVSIVLLSLVSLTLSTPHKCQQFPCGRAAPEVDQQEERAAVKIIVPFDAEVERSHRCQQLPCGRTVPEVDQQEERDAAKIIVPFGVEVERSHQCQQFPCGRTVPEVEQQEERLQYASYAMFRPCQNIFRCKPHISKPVDV